MELLLFICFLFYTAKTIIFQMVSPISEKGNDLTMNKSWPLLPRILQPIELPRNIKERTCSFAYKNSHTKTKKVYGMGRA